MLTTLVMAVIGWRFRVSSEADTVEELARMLLEYGVWMAKFQAKALVMDAVELIGSGAISWRFTFNHYCYVKH